MKDLRGKVLVFLMNAPSAQADDMDYPEEILDYIANWKDDHITDMYGKRIAEVKEQNLWEQKQDESESDYIYRKTNQFRETMQWCIDNKGSNYWVYNAANGYYWDPWGGLKVIPDYATYAQDAYPTFANDIAEMGDARGIVLMDYVGMTEFKRVSANLLLSSFAIFGFVPGIVAALATWTEAVSASNLILFYYTCKMFSKWKYLRTQELINNIVEVNIPSELNTTITDTPIDYARTPDRTVDNAWQ